MARGFRRRVQNLMRQGYDLNQATAVAMGQAPGAPDPQAGPNNTPVAARIAPPPPTPQSLPTPIEAPEAVFLRPSDAPGVKRRKSRRERLGITNRGVSSFSYRSQPMGGVQGGGNNSPLGI